jgi:hypothetical protein
VNDFEKLGVFYLGRQVDSSSGELTSQPVLYRDRDLTTHAIIVGMTGSGKTGLGIAMLEEAAIDGVGAIVIDPKGDMANLALTFPALLPQDFEPWLDQDELQRKGLSRQEASVGLSKSWTEGLADWGQDGSRVARLKEAADVVIYTPGAQFGRGLSIMRTFAAPAASVASQPDLLRERIAGAVSGVLALAGLTVDPLRSREHILLSSILEHSWSQGIDLDLPNLIRQVQSPPFSQLGVFDVESVFSAKDRLELAMALNNLVASPGFSAWTQGDSLDVGKLLRSQSGKPQISVLSLSHLSDAERMFFVTVLLGEVVAWMRSQTGTSSLRGVLYMDEIFGFFPPNGQPPSKKPMLTLLKQARAFGLGVVLSTQNPVDLDYKGLANAGTWFVGRLQTERDKLRLLDGLEGAIASSGQAFDRAELDRMLSGLGNRVFLMNNVHDDGPTLFQSRWALSYLRGPMSREQIQRISASDSGNKAVGGAPIALDSKALPTSIAAASGRPPSIHRTMLGAGLVEFFLATDASSVVYSPCVFASGRVRYVNAKLGINELRSVALTVPIEVDGTVRSWFPSNQFDSEKHTLEKHPAADAAYEPLPDEANRAALHKVWRKEFADHLLHERPLDVLQCALLKLTSLVGESETSFRERIAMAARQKRDELLGALHTKYADKFARASDRVRRAEDRMSREEIETEQQSLDTAFSVGASVLGALMGRRVSPARSIRSAGKGARQHQDLKVAERELDAARQALSALNAELTAKMTDVETKTDVSSVELLTVSVHPKKADVSVGVVGILWQPRTQLT